MGTRSSTPWNSAAKSSSGGSRRDEAEAPDTKSGKVFGVGPAGQHDTEPCGTRVGGQQRGVHRLDQFAVEFRFVRRQFGDPLAGDIRADDLVDLAFERRLPARDHPAVDHRLQRSPVSRWPW